MGKHICTIALWRDFCWSGFDWDGKAANEPSSVVLVFEHGVGGVCLVGWSLELSCTCVFAIFVCPTRLVAICNCTYETLTYSGL